MDYKNDNRKNEVTDSSDDEDSEMRCNKEVYTSMSTWKLDHTAIGNNPVAEEIVDPPALNDTGDIVDLSEQKIDRHSDPDKNSSQSGESRSDKDGHVATHSSPLAPWNQLGSTMCLNDW